MNALILNVAFNIYGKNSPKSPFPNFPLHPFFSRFFNDKLKPMIDSDSSPYEDFELANRIVVSYSNQKLLMKYGNGRISRIVQDKPNYNSIENFQKHFYFKVID